MSDIALTARLDPAWNGTLLDLAEASEDELRYRALLGDVEFRVGDADFSSRWGWIPILDFVLGLNWLLGRLPDSGYEAFEFTESGAELRFELTNDEVEVRSNYVAAVARVSLDELRAAVGRLGRETLMNARQAAPALDANLVFRRWAGELAASD